MLIKILYIVAIIAIIILTPWLAWTYYSSGNLETPTYRTIATYDEFEVRTYDPYLEARVTVDGSWDESINQGFRILAGFIFGGNSATTSIAMTAPVTESPSEKIAMTAPVLEQESVSIAMTAPVTEQTTESERIISFTMPSTFTLETLPIPNDDRIEIIEVPEKTYAVLTFGWYPRDERVVRKKAELLELVSAAGLTPLAPPVFAAYNDPFSFPLLIKNEVWVEVRPESSVTP